jgi:alkylhydroperoxidase family enzyme
MTAPRIPPVEEANDEVQEILTKALRHDGEPLNLFTTVAHHPKLLKRMILFGGLFMTSGRVPTREREIVILRTAFQSGCEYEFGHHRIIGPRDGGLTDAEIDALAEPDPPDLDDGAATLVAMVDDLCRDNATTPETWQGLQQRWDEAEILELLALCGMYRLVAVIVNSAGVALEPGVPGWPGRA